MGHITSREVYFLSNSTKKNHSKQNWYDTACETKNNGGMVSHSDRDCLRYVGMDFGKLRAVSFFRPKLDFGDVPSLSVSRHKNLC